MGAFRVTCKISAGLTVDPIKKYTFVLLHFFYFFFLSYCQEIYVINSPIFFSIFSLALVWVHSASEVTLKILGKFYTGSKRNKMLCTIPGFHISHCLMAWGKQNSQSSKRILATFSSKSYIICTGFERNFLVGQASGNFFVYIKPWIHGINCWVFFPIKVTFQANQEGLISNSRYAVVNSKYIS